MNGKISSVKRETSVIKDFLQQLCDVSEGIPGQAEALRTLIGTSRHLAHQLNNNLTTILANTQLVLLMLKNEEFKPYLKAVEDATRDAAEIVGAFQGAVRSLDQMFQ